jgi:hypothetical protein
MDAVVELEARIAALEAAQTCYRAVLFAINALGANQRQHALAVLPSGLTAADRQRLSRYLFRSAGRPARCDASK